MRLCSLGRNDLESCALSTLGTPPATQKMVKTPSHNNNDSNQQPHSPERFSDFFSMTLIGKQAPSLLPGKL